MGQVDDYLNVVAQGLVRKYVVTGKNEVTIQLATEGHIIQSEISFHTRQPSQVILETIESTDLISMTYDSVQEILATIPIAESLGRALITQMFIKKDTRYFNQLGQSTRQKFLSYVNNHPHMLQRVPQKILASYLNIKPETFSRLKHLIRSQK
jgi:CRP-like cAMP-binding protein